MGRITGGDEYLARLRRLSGAPVAREVTKALFAAGQLIEVEAERSITAGAVSGAGHVPSRPGQPPNADTHGLDRQIETVAHGVGRVTVESNAPYSSFLEFGTSRMEERPFMRPAVSKMRRKAQELVSAAVASIARRRGRR